jgi:hypothetical protein
MDARKLQQQKFTSYCKIAQAKAESNTPLVTNFVKKITE